MALVSQSVSTQIQAQRLITLTHALGSPPDEAIAKIDSYTSAAVPELILVSVTSTAVVWEWRNVEAGTSVNVTLLARKLHSIENGPSETGTVSSTGGSIVTDSGVAWTNMIEEGAAGNGSTDDSAIFSTAQLADTSGVIYCPAATYGFGGNGLVIKATSGTVFKGDGNGLTIFKSLATLTNWLVQTSASYPRQNIVFEDITFDTNGQGLGAFVGYGVYLQGLTFRRCRFLVGSGQYGVILDAFSGATFEECIFHGYGNTNNVGLQLTNGSEKIKVRDCTFGWCGNNFLVDTGSATAAVEDLTDHLDIEDCDFEGGWYARPTLKTNSGGTVTFTANALTDSAGGFNALGLAQFNRVRILTSRRTGTFTASAGTYFTDSGANFNTVLRGEIVRSGTKFAFVSGYDTTDTTRLNIEGWLDSTTYLPVAPPANGAAYTVYKIVTGAIDSWTDTELTMYDGFYDLNGDTSTPANGSLYEVFKPGIYNLHAEYSARNVRVSRCDFLRGWADQCSLYCNRVSITDNTLEYGQDMGITVNGTTGDGYSIVSRNRIFRQGMSPIFMGSCTNGIIEENVAIGNCWVNHVNTWFAGAILLYGANNILVTNNVCDGQSRTLSRAGIAIQADESTSDNITITDNICTGFSVGGIVLYGTLITDHRITNNRYTTISHQTASGGAGAGIAPGGYYGTLYHSDQGVVGTPEGAVIAGPGTQYVASTNEVYLKTSGTSNTNWTLFITSSGTQTITGDKTLSGTTTVAALNSSVNTVTPNAGNPSATTNYNGRMRRYTCSRTINFGSFKANANQEDLLLFQLPAKTKLLGIYVDTTIGFTGNGTTYDLKLGTVANGNELILSHSVLAPVTKGLADADLGASMVRAAVVQGGLIGSWSAGWNIYCRLTADAALGNGTVTNLLTGSFTVYLEYSSF